MTRAIAHQILDAAKRGAPIPERVITRALIVTGDIGRRLS